MVKNNYPQGQLDDMEPSTVQEIVISLKQLHDKGRPTTDEEIKQRIDDFFLFCQHSSIRPGIESLCLSLSITRTSLFNWFNGVGCSPKCQEYVQSAKAFIAAYIEQATLQGKINPASSCFLYKNWLGYRDTISLEDNMPKLDNVTVSRTPEEIARAYGKIENTELFELPPVPED